MTLAALAWNKALVNVTECGEPGLAIAHPRHSAKQIGKKYRRRWEQLDTGIGFNSCVIYRAS